MVDRSDSGLSVFVFEVDTGTGEEQVVSVVDPETVFAHGLCSEAILGTLLPTALEDQQLTPDRFQENAAFVRFLRDLIGERIYDLEELQAGAAQAGSGHLYLIDARAPEADGSARPVDIIGAVTVRGGTMIPGSYQHNGNHRLLTEDGFFCLPVEIEAAMEAELRARCTER